jgi:hypothetical protein
MREVAKVGIWRFHRNIVVGWYGTLRTLPDAQRKPGEWLPVGWRGNAHSG